MTIERATKRLISKPWGRRDLGKWAGGQEDKGDPIGEIWFEPHSDVAQPELLLKLLFTEEKLSIQVHPDDEYAHQHGLERGKEEAWYILNARPDAKIMAGFKRPMTEDEARVAISEGTLEHELQWHEVKPGDLVPIEAGTVHTIGPGLVIAEIQQRSDTTYRLYDYGRDRELHIDDALSVADFHLGWNKVSPMTIDQSRTLMASMPHFAIEKLVLTPYAQRHFSARHETWIFLIDGMISLGDLALEIGEAIYIDDGDAMMVAGATGAVALMFYENKIPAPTMAPEMLKT